MHGFKWLILKIIDINFRY